MEWLSAVSRVLSFVAAGGLLGWYLGHTMAGITVAALAVVFYWSRQMWRLEHWLRDTSGSPPDVPGIWGEMVARGQVHLRDAWWLSTCSGLAIVVTVVAANMVGDGIRDGLDPRAEGES